MGREQHSPRYNYRLTAILALLLMLGIGPFALYHAWLGQWWLAWVPGGVALAIGAAGYAGWRLRDAYYANHVIVAAATVAAFMMLWSAGAAAAYWNYLLVLVAFYFLPPYRALGLMVLVWAAAVVFLFGDTDPVQHARIAVTLLLVTVFAYMFSLDVLRKQNTLVQLASMDPLTGVGNRRQLDRFLAEALDRKRRHGTGSALVMFDIDRFKAINDTYGHAVGDEVLVSLAALIDERIRKLDRFCRFGGEEFVLLLPHADASGGAQVAEQLRTTVAEYRFPHAIRITASFGVAELMSGDSADDWLKRADAALYRAKERGRNRVERG